MIAELLVAGNLFVPLIAERDGHDFIEMAISKGASVAFGVGH